MSPEQQESSQARKVVVALFGATVGGIVFAAIMAPRSYRLVVIIVGLLLVAALLGAFLLWTHRRRKHRNEQFSRGLLGFFDRFRIGRSADQLASLETLKRKFDVLIREYRRAGQDIYEMPWFLIIGPSGSGKSWALKGVKLNPIQDEDVSGPGGSGHPGKGGTLLMDWWTSEQAIVLDTAGGVVFPEEKALESPEWKQLLEYVKTARPECPINGLFVVIPADMLLLDSRDLTPGSLTLDQYAEALRGQIRGRLQRGLQLRFPLYFVITKSDKIPGFREFADQIEFGPAGQRLKEQILGWSNPAKVGAGSEPSRSRQNSEGFQASAVASYLRQVADDIRRHRTAVFGKYAGAGAAAPDQGMVVRREAATLFAFPAAIEGMADRMQAFIESVLQPDRLAPLPPFVRGIYFTSAMREGEVLDPLRARHLGVSLTKLILPGAADRNTAKAFFLRDLFLKKAFDEGGLVMPLTAAPNYLMSRRRALLWSGIAAASILLLVFTVGGVRYNEKISKPRQAWEAIIPEVTNTANIYWYPVIEEANSGQYILVPKNIEQHRQLAILASERIETGLLASLFPTEGIEERLRAAGHVVFERGVLRPLVDYGTNRLTQPSRFLRAPEWIEDGIPDQLGSYEHGFLALLEFLLCPRNLELVKVKDSGARVITNLVSLLITDSTAQQAGTLLRSFDSHYTENANTNRWPPNSMHVSDDTLLWVYDMGFSGISTMYSGVLETLRSNRESITNMANVADTLWDEEMRLLSDFQDRLGDEGLRDQLEKIKTKWGVLTNSLAQAGGSSITNLRSVLSTLTNRVEGLRTAKLGALYDQLMKVNGAVDPSGTALIEPLRSRFTNLSNTMAGFADAIKKPGLDDLEEQIANADRRILTIAPRENVGRFSSERVFEMRYALYDALVRQDLNHFAPSRRVLRENRLPDNPLQYLEQQQKLMEERQLMGMADEGPSPSPSEIVSDYLECVLVERAISGWSNEVAMALTNIDESTIRNARNAREALRAASKAADETLRLDERLAGLSQAATNAGARPPSLSIVEAWRTVGINDRRDRLREALLSCLNRNESKFEQAPFDCNSEKSLLPDEVLSIYREVHEWKKEWNALNEGSDTPVKRLVDLSESIRELEKKFEFIFEPDRERWAIYRLSFASSDDLKNLSVIEVKSRADADDALSAYRVWQFGDRPKRRDPVRRDDIWEVLFPANAGIAVRTCMDTDYPWIDVPSYQDWTILRWMQDFHTLTNSSKWFVPLSFEVSDRDSSRLTWKPWIIVEKWRAQDQRR